MRTDRVRGDSFNGWTVKAIDCLWGLAIVLCVWGCKSMPPAAQQEQMIQDNNILVRQLTAPAFVQVWGKPAYQHSEFTPFFVMPDRTLVPRSRVPLGEAPPKWESGTDAGEGLFYAYPERGWLLVFFEDELVYREELKADQLHALGKTWRHEDRFKTRLEKKTDP